MKIKHLDRKIFLEIRNMKVKCSERNWGKKTYDTEIFNGLKPLEQTSPQERMSEEGLRLGLPTSVKDVLNS